MSQLDPLERRRYHQRYQRKLRDARKAAGTCTECGTGLGKPRVGKTGHRIRRCARCIARQARHNTAHVKQRLRRGRCVSCPRMKPKGDRHWECPACRRRRLMPRRQAA